MPDTSNHNQSYIDSPAKLQEFCQHLLVQDFFTIDTEFIRETNYYPQLCLIQIATATELAWIDPLAIKDLSALHEVLIAPHVTKVFHAARQDIEAFYYLFHDCPRPIFDTQVAASLIGYPDQIGYANLVEQILSVQLDKKHSRTDWSKRPLSQAQLEYAADDVRYLYQIYPVILDSLAKHKRLDWLQADFDFLTRNTTYEVDYENLWKKISGQQKLKRRQLAVLSELAIWREKTAQHSDKPRKWIMPDDQLVSLAIHMPQNVEELDSMRLGKNGVPERLKKILLERISHALSVPEDKWPHIPKYQKLSTEQECVIDAMMSIARRFSLENHLALASVITRKDLEKLLVQPDTDLPIMKGWRYQIVGKQLEKFLAGTSVIGIQSGKLVINET